MDETPDTEASAKLAQYLVVAIQVAESVLRLRQLTADRQATAARQAAAAARAQHTATSAAATVTAAAAQNGPPQTGDRPTAGAARDGAGRLIAEPIAILPAVRGEWTREAGLSDLGRAWGAAAGWADIDPAAAAAADAVEAWLAELAPDAMARYDQLRQNGADRIHAMRAVLHDVVAESRSTPAAADAQAHADTAAGQARRSERIPDDPATPLVDEHTDGIAAATPRRDEQAAWQRDADQLTADQLTAVPGALPRRTTDAGYPHPADVAAAAFPRPYTQVTPALTAAGRAPALLPAARTVIRPALR
jgi:hypothetical protein